MENWDGDSNDPQFASLVASVEHLMRKPSVLEPGTIPETKPEPTTEAVTPRARKIFLSYAREDREIVNRLAMELEKRSFEVFWEPVIRSGQSFDRV